MTLEKISRCCSLGADSKSFSVLVVANKVKIAKKQALAVELSTI